MQNRNIAEYQKPCIVQRLKKTSDTTAQHKNNTKGMKPNLFSQMFAKQSKNTQQHLLWLSKTNDTVSPESSALIVMLSSLLAHLRIFDSVLVSMPSVMFLSHLYGSKPSELIDSDTKLTWLLSMACTVKPLLAQSQLALGTKSFIASRTFLSTFPCGSFASNILII